MYIKRHIVDAINRNLEQFKVVLVTGARQVGKTTLLKQELSKDFEYTTLENPFNYDLAISDSMLFFKQHDLPLIIDEVQRVPELFSAVKFQVDESEKKGQVVLTGSQTYSLMKGVSESLAGRIAIMEMSGLSVRELNGIENKLERFVPHELETDKSNKLPAYEDLWKIIQRGQMPELQASSVDWDTFWSSYVSTYIERDVRDLTKIKDERKFFNFLVACAARTAQIFNATEIANEIDVDYKTVQEWISILQASGIVRLIYPLWGNVSKRLTKSPKLVFLDTGLVCYLTRWTDYEQASTGATSGRLFETFVISEIFKSYYNAGRNTKDIWFYRDSSKCEIDLVVQDGRTLHPIEIKKTANPKIEAAKHFDCLRAFKDFEIGFGNIICHVDRPQYLSQNVQAISVMDI